ncbi:hypothetical protein CLV63_1453 [Murinocardiopsis flavida]|uniref:Uncharacterized protein n=1 Tax=Murinocardiopsis flavida TaxID=645275 RepID=A0A2P8CAB6_9ACTN|nr:hypothetical protein CLV63_1453 [Murinocardiopsis flavida]
MLDAIPVQAVELDKVPEEVLRRLFEAFRLELTYDKWANHVHIRVTLAAESLDESVRAAQRVADPGEGSEMKRWEPSKSVPICEVPPAGRGAVGNGAQLVIEEHVELPASRRGVRPSGNGR